MKITIYGSGYVGLVTGVCLAEVGHHVTCVDIDQTKIDRLSAGHVPIYEPGLEELLVKNIASGHIKFTMDFSQAVAHAQAQFIAVGTPPRTDGSADLTHVLAVARAIAQLMETPKLIVNKSTVPVGTADRVKAEVARVLSDRQVSIDFSVASNPEFLKEGAAVDDFMKPDRIIIGSEDATAEKVLRDIYSPFNRNHDRILVMDVRSAELTKYAANAMLATKISFINEIANIAECVGADIEKVRVGIGSDPRIGYDFIYPGCGYGGSCFPKDVTALAHTANEIGYEAELLQAVDRVNQRQQQRLFLKINQHYDGELRGKKFAIWGLAFKPNTDDIRAASSRTLLEALWNAGAIVQAFDFQAMPAIREAYGDREDLILKSSMEETLSNADALVICTEWSMFRAPDFEFIKAELKEPTIFDGRNLYDPAYLASNGFIYYGIGRGESVRQPEFDVIASTQLESSLL